MPTAARLAQKLENRRLKHAAAGRRPGAKIQTDGKWHDFVYGYEVPKDVVRDEFDYLADGEEDDHFIRYQDGWYHVSQFERRAISGWDGVYPISAFSGLVLKIAPDGEKYKIGYITS